MYLRVLFLCLCLARLSLQNAIGTDEECHPPPTEDKAHFIVGYGSLINSESKNKTYPETGLNIPVRVDGFRRGWTARGYSNFSLSTTYLGVEQLPNAYLNGVIFSIPNAEALRKYDERERYYCRVKVPWNAITILRGKVSDNGTFPQESTLRDADYWIYVTIPQYSAYPNDEYPIVQSYVDIFLSGCIRIERKYGLKNYSEECIALTKGWENPWVNDRLHPRRPFAYQSEAGSIDRLIARFIPNYKSRTYIERIHYGGTSTGISSGSSSLITPLVAVSGSVTAFFLGNRHACHYLPSI